MNTNGYNAAVEIIQYLDANRRIGHTSAMLDGANANCLILTHTQQWADELHKKTDATCLSLSQVHAGSMRGIKKPLLLDNSATLTLLGELVGEIASLRSEMKELRKQHQELNDKVRMVKMILR